ncbi:MAG: phenylalanine--tRNA ligase subunit beta [Verrucomicrobia bacterium]|jgi:phenylalanyl-tRNA synthetase beta chain|nr:phenylalanine--tRNA ligase subunit beta [Verrucomicrobiota bacterium]
MKVTVNGLKQYVDFDWTVEELTERLTMLGLEVEGVETVGGGYDGIVVAEVLESKPHPDADKLSVCQVADGQGTRQIVCGAKNFKVGDKVPMILPGSSLPAKPGEKPFTIKVGKLRGVESCGMMCSGSELGVTEDSDGLMILDANATVGQPFAEYLGCAEQDVVLDLEVTPNRPDYNSVIGIAREIAALTGNPLKWPEVDPAEKGEAVESLVSVRIDDAEKCPRYQARVIKGVKIGPSPNWLKQALEKVGVRSISNVVDVTNFVMLEIGQPLHAFDLNLLKKSGNNLPTVVVRTASDKEPFTTLDDQSHELDSEMLLIADETQGIALAGVMGGLNTEINDQTTDVLLESACFHPGNIRRTSKLLELRTDASYRFERGADVEICDWASRRAAQLILATAGGTLCQGVVDVYPGKTEPQTIALRYAKTDALLGISIPAEEQKRLLESIELKCVESDATSCKVQIPTYRVDLKREIDLIEEVTRLYGVDRIPSTPPRGAHGSNEFDSEHDQLMEARQLLTSMGLFETQGQTLIAESDAKRVANDCVALEYPLSSDMNVLRPSLLPGLLDVLRHNVNHRNTDVAVFEVGRVFLPDENQTRESRRVAIAWTGSRQLVFWKGGAKAEKVDVFDLKGLVDTFLDTFGIRGFSWRTETCEQNEFFVEKASLCLGKNVLGTIGQLMPLIARDYDIKDSVFMAELDLERLVAMRVSSRSFKALPAYPSVRRDIAMLVDETTTHADVNQAVKKAKINQLDSVEVFDIFRGKNVPEGKKSVAYTFVYRDPETTLTDNQVNKAHDQLVQHLQKALGAEMR